MKPYYQDDGITIYHGDCREVLAGMAAGSASLVLTDPPYGTQGLAGGYGRRQNWDTGNGMGRTIANDTDLQMLADAFPLALATVATGWAMVFYAPRKTPELCRITAGAEWFGEIIWDKAAPGLGYHIRYSHENIAVYRVGEPQRPKQPLLSLFRAVAPASLHPHEKPVSLCSALVKWGCVEGGTVLDPFMGSGSTLVAAKNLGRYAIGCDVDEAHCETAALRLGQGVLALECEA
jgi:tRNA G10  N-methylase Trm11